MMACTRTVFIRARSLQGAAFAAMLATLTVAMPAAAAAPCGDLDASGTVVATDALLLLRKAVNQPVNIQCRQFPASGQTTPYAADTVSGGAGTTVADDGTLRTGAPAGFVDNGDGTITDTNTGLMWEKKGDEGGLHDKDLTLPWSSTATDTIWDWLVDINAEGGDGFAGYDDWRIPNIKELQSILDYERAMPSIDPVFHTACIGGCSVTECSCTGLADYWSATTNRVAVAGAWRISFTSQTMNQRAKDFPLRVRAVRGGD
jgi:hypothetical protein